jgi:redox-sensitive bicupin YhaK (pirin superfamily)
VISEGKKVAVRVLSGKTVNGKMAAWTPDSLTVTQRNDKTVQLAKSDVTQVLLVTGKPLAGRLGASGAEALLYYER